MSEKTTIAKVKSLVLHGRDAVEVTVEAGVTHPGIGIHLVGLADREVKESLLRVRTALQSCGFSVPGAKIIINITPALPGSSSDPLLGGGVTGLDAAIAVAILEASGQTGNSFFSNSPDKYVVGELGLDGGLRSVPGTLSFIRKAVNAPYTPMLFLPQRGIPDGWEGLVGGGCDQVVAVRNIVDLVACSRNSYAVEEGVWNAATADDPRTECTDFLSVPGYGRVKRVMQVAAAGGFDIALVGKRLNRMIGTFARMFAQLLRDSFRGTPFDHRTDAAINASVLGRYGEAAALGFFPVTEIYPDSGLNSAISGAAYAHNGVIALGDVSDFKKSVIEALRGVHEDCMLTISTLRHKVTYPASFSLLLGSDRAPVSGDPSDKVRDAVKRLCGGDQLWCWESDSDKDHCLLTTADAAAAVRKAVERQTQRQEGRLNADLTPKELDSCCFGKEGQDCQAFIQKVFCGVGLPATDYYEVLRTARTIADLDGCEHVTENHICEAVGFKTGDRLSL